MEQDIILEKVYVIEIYNENLSEDFVIREIYSLIDSAGATPIGHKIVKLRQITPATYIGSGKIEEIKAEIDELNANLVVFDGALSPSQTLNLSDALGVKVIDRTTLILDIFARSAKTHEGKIQVELAQLEYLYPRLKGKGQALSRLGGGIGTRGPGETKLETDRRHIRGRIDKLKEELENLKTRRKLQAYRRDKNEEFVISLVGYTNVGKSTLLNRLTGADVLVKNQLFATLDPTVRKTKINGVNVLISDTVGFIRDIPHDLIEAFKSTLESAVEADLIIIVLDALEDYNEQLNVTKSTLSGLNCTKDTIIAINKCDKIENFESINPEFIPISAKEGKNLDKLFEKIETVLSKYYVKTNLNISYQKLNKFNQLKKYLEDIELLYEEESITATITVKKSNFNKFVEFK